MKNLVLNFIALTIILGCSKPEETKSFLFNEISPEHSSITFNNLVTEDSEKSIISYIYYYNGGGVAAGDINNDGLPDLYFVSNTGKNKLYLNKGNFQFEDISIQAGVEGNASWNTGVTMVDINGDGLVDIYVCAVSGILDFTGKNELYINNGDGTFTESASLYGLDFEGYSTQAYFFDYDKDGDLDMYLVNHAVHTALNHSRADNKNKRVSKIGDVLFKNDNGKFVDVSVEAGIFGGENGYGLSASIADFNNDGWDDIYVCNDFHEDDYFYLNNGDGTFKECHDKFFTIMSRFSMGSDASDVNGDGFQDLITLDMLPNNESILKQTEGDDAMLNMQDKLRMLGYKDQYSRNMLQINQNGSYFYEVALFNKVADTDWSWSPLFADFNNDGHQDLFISNGILRRPNGLDFKNYISNAFRSRSFEEGQKWLYNSIGEMPNGVTENEIFEGNSQSFKKQTGLWFEAKSRISNGSIYVDLDLDGDLDLVMNNFGEVASILENTSNNSSNNFISLTFKYKDNNLEGIGTKAIAYSNGKSQIKQLFKSRGFQSSVDASLHFGFGQQNQIDSIITIWPDNSYQTMIKPQLNSKLHITYLTNNPIYNYQPNHARQFFKKETNLLTFTHEEDNYLDFTENKLIPYKISTLGPAVAIGDVNNNGFEDVFIGNASGYPARLFINDGNSFKSMNIKNIVNDSIYEDNSAVLFDSNNDGFLDLYVGSGITKNRDQTKENDRLYLNIDGKFFKSTSQIPLNNLVTSCVIAYDYDQDGDTDLFIGNLADPNDFGKNVDSYILVNDGKGNFTKDKNFKLEAKVTAAEWADLNNDGVKDLLVATEWGAPYIFLNNKGVLESMELPKNINGLWQSILSYDIDQDGDEDILLGNWGLNTKFNLYNEGFIKMYHSDFDKNGKTETILTYQRKGKEYPIHSKDELGSQILAVKKYFPSYELYSGKTINQILPKEALEAANISIVNNLSSGYLENNNGKFDKFIEFNSDFQLAPINAFKPLNINNNTSLLVAGNSKRQNSYHGSYTSLKGILLTSLNNYSFISDVGMQPFHEAVKKIETVKMENHTLVLVFFNNADIKVYNILE